MRWSLGLGRIAGIRIYVHFTFFILLAWIALGQAIATGSWQAGVGGLVLFSSLAVIIVLHELGHALTAKYFGIRTRDITLLPIGGVARLERMPEKPLQELAVALAGPAVNVVLAGLILIGLLIGHGGPLPLLNSMQTEVGFFEQLFLINLVLAAFNMLPAFPMDGGRVLRALLALPLDYVTATRTAAYVGQGMAVLFALFGLFIGNPILLLIALFVWTGAQGEAGMVATRAVLARVPVSRLMVTHFQTLHPTDSIGHAAELVSRSFQQDFPVVDRDELVGMVTRSDLISALSSRHPEAPVEDVMRPSIEELNTRDTLQTAFDAFQRSESPALPVTHRGQLVGILTLDRIGEYVARQERSYIPPRHREENEAPWRPPRVVSRGDW